MSRDLYWHRDDNSSGDFTRLRSDKKEPGIEPERDRLEDDLEWPRR